MSWDWKVYPLLESEYCLWFLKLVYVIRKMKFVYIIRKRMPSCEQLHAHWTLASRSSLITNAGLRCFRLTVPPLSSHSKDWPGPGAQTWEERTEAKASCGHAKQRLRHALWLEIKTGLATQRDVSREGADKKFWSERPALGKVDI